MDDFEYEAEEVYESDMDDFEYQQELYDVDMEEIYSNITEEEMPKI